MGKYISNPKQGFLQKVTSRKLHVTEVHFCDSKKLSLAVIENWFSLNK